MKREQKIGNFLTNSPKRGRVKEAKKTKSSGVVISIVIIAVIVLIILGIGLLSKKNVQDETPEEDLPPQENIITETSEPAEYIVEITNEGFVPKNLEIKQGDKVTWINKLITEAWPASAFHPTHTNYPGSSIIKCGTVEEKNIFDACGKLQKGESYSFVFNEVGSWAYHNHLQPSKDGKIIVS